MYKQKSILIILLSLLHIWAYDSPTGWFMHIECQDMMAQRSTFEIPLVKIRVVFDDREYENEAFDPKTNTIYLSPIWFNIR